MPEPEENTDQNLLGKYRIIERIGSGGMAEVYLGRHDKLNREVAIKVLRPSLINDPQFTARFEREARLAANLRHPGIVQVFDFDTEDDRHYLIMEYIKGGTLKARLQSLRNAGEFMPLDEISHYLTRIAEALDYAHSQGMLHRDLKPANILIDPAGNSYLADFGIARLAGEPEITHTGTLMGTPSYMSPEQCEGLPLTGASDLYSLGIILYEMLTGGVPFDAESPLAILQKHIHEAPPPLNDIRPELPAALNSFMQCVLAKNPMERFPNALKMAEEFKRIAAVPNGNKRGEDAVETLVVQPSGNRDHQSMPLGKSKISAAWWVTGIVILVILTAAGLLIWFSRQTNLTDIRRCTTPSTCQAAAQIFSTANRPLLAIEAYSKAISLVPAGDQKEWSQLHCDLADLYVRVNKKNDARASYKDCINWTRNDPAQVELRLYAQQKLNDLN